LIRGEIYRTREKLPERGNKPGYYLVVSRTFIASNDDIATVVCAPIYSEVLGISTELVLGSSEGLRHASAARCDFLMLMFKSKLTAFVGALDTARFDELDSALRIALAIR
jgi:mRNA-degrading endonuclease toxin of MazEF toxin-antitoxin module